jgi:hypothetical protein
MKWQPKWINPGDQFGRLAMRGRFIVAGAHRDNKTQGSVSVYDQFNQKEHLISNPDPERNDQFGSSVAIDYHQSTGWTLAITAVGDTSYSGAVYIFKYEGGEWVPK